MRLRALLAAAFCVFLATLLSGCAGYHVGPVKPKFMGDIESLAVLPFKSSVLEPRIEVQAANAVIKQFQQDGTYRILPANSADAILRGTITKIERVPARGVKGNVIATDEFELVLELKVDVIRRTTKEVIETRTVDGRTSFFVGGDLQQQERQAIPLALENAAERLVSVISEGW